MKIVGDALRWGGSHPLDTGSAVDPEGASGYAECRPMRMPGTTGPLALPADLPKARVLFRSGRTISGGVVERIRYILYIDPKRYAAIADADVKKTLGRVVGRINEHPEIAGQPFVMMGPGRWGSSNIDLGVNVSYADINNTSVLVEIAREEAGHVPEVSLRAHFFLDLVEAGSSICRCTRTIRRRIFSTRSSRRPPTP